MYFGLGSSVVGAGTVNIPGLFYNMNVGATWYGFLISRQRVRTSEYNTEATRNDVLLRTCLAYVDRLSGRAADLSPPKIANKRQKFHD